MKINISYKNYIIHSLVLYFQRYHQKVRHQLLCQRNRIIRHLKNLCPILDCIGIYKFYWSWQVPPKNVTLLHHVLFPQFLVSCLSYLQRLICRLPFLLNLMIIFRQYSKANDMPFNYYSIWASISSSCTTTSFLPLTIRTT